jgi:hypothetical protein
MTFSSLALPPSHNERTQRRDEHVQPLQRRQQVGNAAANWRNGTPPSLGNGSPWGWDPGGRSQPPCQPTPSAHQSAVD